ncbi:MAG: P-II family nitrogen regulator [Candidatus Lokiarchaeota archaeon]|nr:P-II family nitrogen regulator [Candidatus Lokiarchaeota archaeon]MBD3340618.1 P-II family nitrogen regulator [Candidatus Lokiarchaeota archaeon]
MKKIECFIRPEKLEPVKNALAEKGIKGMSVFEVKGRGNQGGIWLTSRSGKYCVQWIDKLKLEIVVNDTVNLEEIVDIIIENAETGKPGDGKIFITPVERAIRIRTKENGEEIL